MKKKIVIACGAGIATSTLVVQKLEQLLVDNQLDYNTVQCTYAEVDGFVDEDTALIISSSNIAKDIRGVKVLVALPFISGFGVAEFEKEILSYLK